MRALAVAMLFTSGCLCASWPPWKCESDPQPTCNHAALDDAGPDLDAGVAYDAPPGPDAMPRAADPSLETCVAAWSGPECTDNDKYEPNNGMVQARYLKSCAMAIQGASGKQDVDVYRTGDCSFGTLIATGPLMPWAQLDPQDASAGSDVSALRLCVFPTCATGATNVYACIETDSGVSASSDMTATPADLWRNDIGFRGCCRVGPGRITVKSDCPRRSPTIDTYVWVEPLDHTTESCDLQYTLSYNTSCTPPGCP